MSKYKYEKEFMFSDRKADEVSLFLKDAGSLDISQIKDEKKNTVVHQCASEGEVDSLKCYINFMREQWNKTTKTFAEVNEKIRKWVNEQNL